jgi:hypothetical protein
MTLFSGLPLAYGIGQNVEKRPQPAGQSIRRNSVLS